MKIEFKEKIEIEPLFSRLKQVVQSIKDNKVYYHLFDYKILEWVFLGLLKFDSKLPMEHKKTCLSKSLSKIVLDDKYEEEYLLELLEQNVKLYTRKRTETFYLIAALSLKDLDSFNLDFKDSSINFFKELPEPLRIARAKLDSKDGDEFTKVVVTVKDFDFLFAKNKAFRYLEVIRGMLNLVINSDFRLRLGMKTSEPINRIRFSEIITLHAANDIQNEKIITWHILDYAEPKLVILPETELEEIKNFLIKNNDLLQKCEPKHREDLISAFQFFSKAFDEPQHTLAFLNAWNVLELLTNTDNNSILIKRATALMNNDIKKWVVLNFKALRNFRNESVHEGTQDLDAETACFMIQKMISNLIFKFNLTNAGFFRNLEDSVFYLDKMGVSPKENEKHLELLTKVKKHQENR